MSMEASRAWFLKLAAAVGDSFVTNRRRPILTLVEDTSGGAHDMLMAACDAQRYGLLGVKGHHDNCRDNLHAGAGRAGRDDPRHAGPAERLHEHPVDGRRALSWGEPVSPPGSYARFRAEMDLIVAFSACPRTSCPSMGGPGRRPRPTSRSSELRHRVVHHRALEEVGVDCAP